MTAKIVLITFGLLAIAAIASARQVKDNAAVPPANAPSVELQQQSLRVQQDSARRQLSPATAQKPLAPDNFIAPMADEADDFIVPLIPPSPHPPDCPPLKKEEVDTLVKAAAAAEQVKPELIRAVMKQESGFKPCAVSPRGAQGLMQLMPDTAWQFNVSDPLDPTQNVLGGAAFLKQLLAKYKGDLKLVLNAYNAGVIDSASTPAETQNYTSSILADLASAAKKQ